MSHLFDAINSNNINLIKSLINNNEIDINEIDSFGNSPLIIAIYKKHIEIAKLLISNNANTEIKNKHGQNALFYSVLINSAEIFNILLNSKNIDINIKDEFGRTLFSLAQNNKNNVILEILKSYKNPKTSIIKSNLPPSENSSNKISSKSNKIISHHYETNSSSEQERTQIVQTKITEPITENKDINVPDDNAIISNFKTESNITLNTTELNSSESKNSLTDIDSYKIINESNSKNIINDTVFESQNNEHLNPNEDIIDNNIEFKNTVAATNTHATDVINDNIIEIINIQPQNFNDNSDQSDIASALTNEPQSPKSIEEFNFSSPLITNQKIVDNNNAFFTNLINKPIDSNIAITIILIEITVILFFLKFGFSLSAPKIDPTIEYAKGINYYYEHNDYKKAAECFEKASAQGDKYAEYFLSTYVKPKLNNLFEFNGIKFGGNINEVINKRSCGSGGPPHLSAYNVKAINKFDFQNLKMQDEAFVQCNNNIIDKIIHGGKILKNDLPNFLIFLKKLYNEPYKYNKEETFLVFKLRNDLFLICGILANDNYQILKNDKYFFEILFTITCNEADIDQSYRDYLSIF